MEPLMKRLHEKETIKKVEEHLDSFIKIRHLYTMEDCDEVDLSFYVQKDSGRNEYGDALLKKIHHLENVNRITREYVDRMWEAIDSLQPYHQVLLLYRYYYDMDEEELVERLHFSARKIYKDLKEAKIHLAFRLGCEQYKE